MFFTVHYNARMLYLEKLIIYFSNIYIGPQFGTLGYNLLNYYNFINIALQYINNILEEREKREKIWLVTLEIPNFFLVTMVKNLYNNDYLMHTTDILQMLNIYLTHFVRKVTELRRDDSRYNLCRPPSARPNFASYDAPGAVVAAQNPAPDEISVSV